MVTLPTTASWAPLEVVPPACRSATRPVSVHVPRQPSMLASYRGRAGGQRTLVLRQGLTANRWSHHCLGLDEERGGLS